MKIKHIFAQLTDKELQKAFQELKEWMETSILKREGYVRALHEDCETQLDMDIDLRVVETQILYEMGERFTKLEFKE